MKQRNVSAKKQKGYVLAIVMILCLVMTVTVTTAFNLVYGYYIHSKRSMDGLHDKPAFSTTVDDIQTSEPVVPEGEK